MIHSKSCNKQRNESGRCICGQQPAIDRAKAVLTETQRACEFEALVCETNAIGVEVAGMKALNKERELNGLSIAYSEDSFWQKSLEFRAMAGKFRMLAE